MGLEEESAGGHRPPISHDREGPGKHVSAKEIVTRLRARILVTDFPVKLKNAKKILFFLHF